MNKHFLISGAFPFQFIITKIKWLLAILFLAFSGSVYGQSPGWGWATAAPGGGSDIGSAIAKDASGNVYVTGSFDGPSVSFGSNTFSNPGLQQMFLVKYSPTGAPLWAVASNCSSMASGHGVAVDGNGDVYVTGGFDFTISFGSTTLSTGGVFLAKFSSAGTLQWAVAPGGAVDNTAAGKGVAIDASGNVFITGRYFNPLTFGATTISGAGVFVARYNASGSAIWARSATTTNFADANGITLDPAGDVYITGYFHPSLSFGSTTHTSAAGADIFVAKYDASGAYQWSSAHGGADNDYGYAIAADANGIYATGVIGVTSSSVAFGATTLSASGYTKAFLVKYSSSGSVVWANGVGGTSSSVSSNGIAVDASGNLYLAGSFSSGSSFTVGPNTLNNVSLSPIYGDVFVAKYNSSGTAVWGKSAGGIYLDQAYGITVDASGNPFITGWYNSNPVNFGGISLSNPTTTYDVFVAKLGGGCTSVPAQPGSISGPASVCAGSSKVYSVTAVTGASSYTWTLPAGWSGVSTANSITAIAGTSGGTISVAAGNGCGISLARTLAISLSASPSPVITLSTNTLTTTVAFSSYAWYRNGVPIAGANSRSYTATQTGNYYVIVTNSNNCSGQSNIKSVTKISQNGRKEINVYQTPRNGIFGLQLPDGKMPIRIDVYNVQGALVQQQTLETGTNYLIFEVEQKVPGAYLVKILYPDEVYYQKVVIR